MSIVALQPPILHEDFTSWIEDLLARAANPADTANASGWLPDYQIEEQREAVGNTCGLSSGPARTHMLVVLRNAIAQVTMETHRVPIALAWRAQLVADAKRETPGLEAHYPWLKDLPDEMALCQLCYEISSTRPSFDEI